MILLSIFSPRISSNFGANSFTKGSSPFVTLNFIVLSSLSKSNLFRNKKSCNASIFCFSSVIDLLILYL